MQLITLIENLGGIPLIEEEIELLTIVCSRRHPDEGQIQSLTGAVPLIRYADLERGNVGCAMDMDWVNTLQRRGLLKKTTNCYIVIWCPVYSEMIKYEQLNELRAVVALGLVKGKYEDEKK